VTIWQGLLVNLAILSIFISIWMQAYDAIERMPRWLGQLTLAVLFAAVTIMLMLMPFQIVAGIQAALRTTVIVTAGLFGGPFIAVATAIAAVTTRFYLGGQGAAQGVIAIGGTFIIAIAAYLALRGRRPGVRDVVLTSAAGAAGLPLSWWLWAGNPTQEMFINAWIPIVTLAFVATAVAGMSIVREERRVATERENRLFAAAFRELPNPMNVKDRGRRFVIANPAMAAALGVSGPDALIGRTASDFYSAEIARRVQRDDDRVLSGGAATTDQRQLQYVDGSIHWLKTTKAPLHDQSGSVVGVITHSVDVTESQLLADANEEIGRQLTDALESMSDGLVVFDADKRIVICNTQYSEMFPRTADLRVPGVNLRDILRAAIARGEEDLPEGLTLEEWIEQASSSLGGKTTRDIHLNDGRWIEARVRPSQSGRTLSLVSDVTAARVAQRALEMINARLETLAATDSLTGLANRRALDDALAREHARALRNGSSLSVLVIDVDRFKAYNDTYGHPRGDECLKLISAILRAAIRRPADVIARFGGEEFVVLLPDTDAAGAWARSEEIRKALKELNIPHAASEKGRVTVTIGAATMTSEDHLPGDLVRRADEALYAGKASGRDQIQRSRTDRELMQLAG
jgi:diguanylate cyclase (GGDEF)-like protein/PAS domain S-box-containing protein